VKLHKRQVLQIYFELCPTQAERYQEISWQFWSQKSWVGIATRGEANNSQPHSIQTGLWGPPSPLFNGCWGSFPRVLKCPGREAERSFPSTAEIMNVRAVSPLCHIFSWRGPYLIRHRDNFNFTFLFLCGINRVCVKRNISLYLVVAVIK
jgi:hypothetical protein